jgi:hypothetical protein
MKLREKFTNLLKYHFNKGKLEELLLDAIDDDLIQISEDFTISFSDWKDNQPTFFLFEENGNKKTNKKLLKIFKKELRL